MKAYNELTPSRDDPIAEIELWRNRSALIGTIYENMLTPEFKKMMQVVEQVPN